MNFVQLVDAVSRSTRRPKRQVAPVARAIFREIQAGIRQDGEVAIYDFGRFAVKTQEERTARDWPTGEAITLPAAPAVKFVPGASTARAARRPRK